jgi:hypothetical protein
MPRRLRRAAVATSLLALALLAARAGVGASNRRTHAHRARDDVRARPPRTFYLSPRGNDAAAGTEPARAWRTVARASREVLAPGDSVLLQGGATFPGTLRLEPEDVGTPARPVTITTWGAGRATIDAGAGTGVLIHNTGGVRIARLVVVGTSRAALDSAQLAGENVKRAARTNAGLPSGIVAVNDLLGDVPIASVRIEDVEVAGFAGHGLLVDGARWFSGFRDVRIDRVAAHDNGLSGVSVLGEYPKLVALLANRLAPRYAHEDVAVRRVRAYGNTGLPGRRRANTGSGIVLASVRRGLVEDSEAYDNGRWCDSQQGGPVGIWAWDADRVVIQRNRSHHNRVAGRKDGGGFDLDGGVSNSVVQNNTSWENDGAGYLLFQFAYARPFRGNLVRGNVSRDDGRRNGYAGIHAFGDLRDTRVYGNTVEVGPAAGGVPRAVAVQVNSDAGPGTPGVTHALRIERNVLRVRGGVPAIYVDTGHVGLVFAGNRYVAVDSPVTIVYGGRTYRDVAAWRAATGQERALVSDRASGPDTAGVTGAPP